MNDRALNEWHDISGRLMEASLSGTPLPLPHGQEIMLIELNIAGLQFYDAREIWEAIKPEMVLTLKRNPENKYDALAIEVWTADGRQLGHLPRNQNEILARLMDAGKVVKAVVCNKCADFEPWGVRTTVSLVEL